MDAEDANATAFYARYDFVAFPINPQRLFLPVSTIEKLFG